MKRKKGGDRESDRNDRDTDIEKGVKIDVCVWDFSDTGNSTVKVLLALTGDPELMLQIKFKNWKQYFPYLGTHVYVQISYRITGQLELESTLMTSL